MKVQPIFAPNETEEVLVEAYRSRAGELPGADNGRMHALRDRSIARFEATGLPHRRIETWKYTDLRRFLNVLPEDELPSAEGLPATQAGLPLVGAFASLDAHWLVFVDGRFARHLSGGRALPRGVDVSVLSEAAIPEWAVDEMSRIGAGDVDSVFDLNTALMEDGALLRVSEGTGEEVTVGILHLGHGAGTRHLRHVIVVGDGAKLNLIEAYGASGSKVEVTTAAAIWSIGDNATINHVKVQQTAPSTIHLAPQHWTIGAEADVSTFTLTLGGKVSREERRVRCAGEASNVSVSGTYFLDGATHADTTLVVTHTAPGCTSRERFKGLVADRARGVFQGCIIVERGAQKTDANQSVNALLLSDDAHHDAKPELEIYADDVQCGHGATTGELDETALFYLRSRGIPRPEAERLLIAAFIRDGLAAVEHDGLREALTGLAEARLEARATGGSDA